MKLMGLVRYQQQPVKMTIIYSVTIRALKVKDLNAVDTSVAEERSSHEYRKAAIANKTDKLKTVAIEGQSKGELDVFDCKIPEDTEVLAFTNSACEEIGPHRYLVVINGQRFYKECRTSNNRFMIIVPPPAPGKPNMLEFYGAGPASSEGKNVHDLEDLPAGEDYTWPPKK